MLNSNMWIQELGELYEGWNPGRYNAPTVQGVPTASETKDSIRMRRAQPFGAPQDSTYNISGANSNQMPYEQEEVSTVPSNSVLKLIDYEIQKLSDSDSSALFALKSLKNNISKL